MNKSKLQKIGCKLKPVVSKFRAHLSARLNDITEKQIPAKLKPIAVKGIIRPFELGEIYVFYYLIDAGELSYSNDMH